MNLVLHHMMKLHNIHIADRNFLICTVGGVERVLSVDEDPGPPQTLLGMLKKQRCELGRRVAAERAAELSAEERAALAR